MSGANSMEAWTIVISVALSFALFVIAQRQGWGFTGTKEVRELRQQVQWLTGERNQLLADLAAANRLIQDLRSELDELRAQVVKSKPHVVVLGIWPVSNIDSGSERDAVYDSGVEYRALTGESATRANILRELRIGGITAIEIGSHGDVEHIIINDLQLSAGWWQRVLTGRGVNVAVILACFSDHSVADAMKRAGVKHVVAVTGEIEDAAAVEFAQQFYQLYAAGMDVPRAFDEAKLVLDYRQAEKLVLR